MFLFRITFSPRQSTNSSLRSLHMNQICKLCLEVFDKPKTVFYCCLREKSTIKYSNILYELNKLSNHDNNKINRHRQQCLDLHEKAFDFQNSMKNINKTSHIKKLYPNPMTDLSIIYDHVDVELNQKCLSVSYSKVQQKDRKMKCVIDVRWPNNMSFSSEEANKRIARDNAALQCLEWLSKNKKIKRRVPIIYNYKNIQDILRAQRFVEINLESEFKNDIRTLIHTFKQTIEPVIKEQLVIDLTENDLKETKSTSEVNLFSDTIRNNELATRLQSRTNKVYDLPIDGYRQIILDTLKHNQILLIKGSTGCGKSTQVPQFIMDEYTKENRASECNIIVVQTRRIAAISLAHRIASERNEKIGDVIGYHIRFDNVRPKAHGSVVFVTPGILLRTLQNDPTLEGVSHVIVDEAHERRVETDILLKLIKEILQKNQRIKLIVMSATINEDLFQQYLSCEVIDIPGKLYPVKMHFIEDIQIFENTSKQNDLMKLKIPFDKIVKLVEWIVRNKPPGCILCFLPGWQEIKYTRDSLQNAGINNLSILPLHSKVPYHNQLKVFQPVPKGNIKVILATDIAECSITIEDVSYVIDTVIKKEYKWNYGKSEPSLNYQLISKANIDQRKGRAGRIKPGESYHLITREEYNTLHLYPTPDILTSPLERAIILCKTLSNETIYDFFNSMLQSPYSETIFRTVNNLKTLGILDDDENLTSLGKRISYFSLDPVLSKAVVLSYVFECLKPISLLVSLPFGENLAVALDQTSNGKLDLKSRKRMFHETSDHIALLKYYKDWKSLKDDDETKSHSPSPFDTVNQLHKAHLNELADSGMLQSLPDSANYMSGNNYELIRAVIFAATNHLIKRESYGYKSGHFTKNANRLKTEDTETIELGSESVNYKRKEWPSCLMTYFHKRRSYQMLLTYETSMLTPLSVLLFSRDVLCYKETGRLTTEQGKVCIKIRKVDNVQFYCDEETANLLLQFRSIMWDVVNYQIKYEGVDTNQDNLEVVKCYKRKVLAVLASMLEKSSRNIDSS